MFTSGYSHLSSEEGDVETLAAPVLASVAMNKASVAMMEHVLVSGARMAAQLYRRGSQGTRMGFSSTVRASNGLFFSAQDQSFGGWGLARASS